MTDEATTDQTIAVLPPGPEWCSGAEHEWETDRGLARSLAVAKEIAGMAQVSP